MRVAIFALWMTMAPSAAAAPPLDVSGAWLTNRHDAIVSIADCGDSTPCGRVVWVTPAKGRHPVDARNPDPAKRGQKVVGSTVASGFSRRDGGWTGGRLYNPETGQTFDATMTLAPDGRLAVTGCLGPLCLTRYWTRSRDVAEESRHD